MTELTWRKSSFSGGGGSGECVEVAVGRGGLVHLRESDRPGEIVSINRITWHSFLESIKAGDFDSIAA